jgi:hypothetical protein
MPLRRHRAASPEPAGLTPSSTVAPGFGSGPLASTRSAARGMVRTKPPRPRHGSMGPSDAWSH